MFKRALLLPAALLLTSCGSVDDAFAVSSDDASAVVGHFGATGPEATRNFVIACGQTAGCDSTVPNLHSLQTGIQDPGTTCIGLYYDFQSTSTPSTAARRAKTGSTRSGSWRPVGAR